MKIINNIYIQILCVLATTLCMHSCSCNKGDEGAEAVKLDNQIKTILSDDVSVVTVLNIERLFSETGVTVNEGKINLPTYMRDFINSMVSSDDRADLNEVLDKVQGIAYQNAVMAIKGTKNAEEGIIVFGVNDEDQFIESITEGKKGSVGEVEDYTTVPVGHNQILIKDHLAFVVNKNGKPVASKEAAQIVNDWKKDAENKPLADWKKNYLSESRVVSMLIDNKWGANLSHDGRLIIGALGKIGMSKAESGFTAMGFNLNGPSVELKTTMFDISGQNVPFDIAGNFNTDLMKYAYPKDILALGGSVNEKGRRYISDFMMAQFDDEQYHTGENVSKQKEMFDKYMQCFGDGGMFVSIGLAEGVDLSNFNYSSSDSYHFVIANNAANGKAAELYSMVCTNIGEMAAKKLSETNVNGMRITTFEIPDIFSSYSYYSKNIPLYIALDGDNIVISNDEIRRNDVYPFNKNVFAGSLFAAQAVVPSDNEMISQFINNLGVDIELSVKPAGAEAKMTLSNTSKNFIQAYLENIPRL